MVLKIIYNDDHFTIHGDLNQKTFEDFIQTFQKAFLHSDEVTIDIQGLKSIDRHGVNALAKLHNESLLNGKKLQIIGMDTKEIYDNIEN